MSDLDIEHRHGSADLRVTSVPEVGRGRKFGDVAIKLVTGKTYEVNFQAHEDLISLTMGAIRGREALNSDRKAPFNVSAGTISFYPAGSTVFITGEEVRGDFVSFAIKPLLRERVLAEVDQSKHPFDHRRCARLKTPNALALAAATRRLILGEHTGGCLVSESLAVLALADFVEAAIRSNAPPPSPARALGSKELDAVYAQIEERLADDLSLAELAACIGLSPYHFGRAFRAATGLSPYQYVLERRLAHVRSRLEVGRENLADIAYAFGFSSQAHMTDVFKKRFGITPGRYRKDSMR